jgi:hypothetical protein
VLSDEVDDAELDEPGPGVGALVVGRAPDRTTVMASVIFLSMTFSSMRESRCWGGRRFPG